MAGTRTAGELAQNFDFSDDEVKQQRTAVYAELRKGPPNWSDAYGGHWVVSRYDDLKEMLGNPTVFCSSQGTTLPPTGFPIRFPPNEADPPDHSKWRKLTAPFFTSSAVAGLEASIRGITRERLATFVEKGQGDLAQDLAQPIPAYVIADMMGFPREDAPWFAAISDHLLVTAERKETEENAKAGLEFVEFLSKSLEDRRGHPQDDLLTELVNGTIDGRPLTFEEMLGVAFFFLIAGHETTVGGMTFLLWRLGLNPDQRQRLIDDRSLIPKAIEELLRIDSPVLHLARTVTEDTVLGGASMKAGDKVMVLYAAANLDEAVFPDAAKFDIDRENARKHVAFSSSIHMCQGAGLARLEMRVLVEEVLNTIPDYHVDVDNVKFRSIQGVHSVKSLPVTFAPTSAAGLVAPPKSWWKAARCPRSRALDLGRDAGHSWLGWSVGTGSRRRREVEGMGKRAPGRYAELLVHALKAVLDTANRQDEFVGNLFVGMPRGGQAGSLLLRGRQTGASGDGAQRRSGSALAIVGESKCVSSGCSRFACVAQPRPDNCSISRCVGSEQVGSHFGECASNLLQSLRVMRGQMAGVSGAGFDQTGVDAPLEAVQVYGDACGHAQSHKRVHRAGCHHQITRGHREFGGLLGQLAGVWETPGAASVT